MTREDVRRLPIRFRHWYIVRLKKELEVRAKAAGAESSDPLTESQKAAVRSQLPPSTARKF